MNLKSYYAKVHEVESSLEGDHVLVVSEATADGGRAGVMTLTAKRTAAQLIVEGRARVATEEERTEWELEEEDRRDHARREEMAQRIQVQVIAESEPGRKPRQS